MTTNNDTPDEYYDDGDTTTVTSSASSSVYSNNSGSHQRKTTTTSSSTVNKNNNNTHATTMNMMDHIDEEQGVTANNYKHKNSSDGSSGVKKKKKNARRTTKSHLDIDTSSSSVVNPLLATTKSTTTNTPPADKHNDKRSKALFLKTAFWITAWYFCSLATLFLNKIILSRKGSSVHVLGMCQMTTAAIIGGWSSFGGLEWGKNLGKSVLRSFGVRIVTGVEGSGAELEKRGEQQQHYNNNNDGTASTDDQQQQTQPLGRHHPTFARDMSIVGLLRGLTVVLGLIALEHVPVSFVETIKATAPAFTVIFARLILKEHTPSPVMLTLIPVVAGLVLCSKSELRFDTIGFLAATIARCECYKGSRCGGENCCREDVGEKRV